MHSKMKAAASFYYLLLAFTCCQMLLVNNITTAEHLILDADLVEGLVQYLQLRSITVVSQSAFRTLPALKGLYAGGRMLAKVIRTLDDRNATRDNLIIDMGSQRWESFPLNLLGVDVDAANAATVLVFDSSTKTTSVPPPLFKVHQRIYFAHLDSGLLSERYEVGQAQVDRDLARYNVSGRTFEAVVDEYPASSFASRRSNFHGARLKTMVCTQSPFLNVIPLDKGDDEAEGAKVEELLGDGQAYEVLPPERMKGLFRDLQVQQYSKACS